MPRYKIVIVVKADSVDDAEYMARAMLGAAYDSVLDWRVEAPKGKRRKPAKAVR